MIDYCSADMPMPKVNEPRETAKGILGKTDQILEETYASLNQLSHNLIGEFTPADNQKDTPQDMNMMETLMRQRAQAERILQIVIKLTERLY